MKNIEKYCTFDGCELSVDTWIHPKEFDEYTGKSVEYTRFRCPLVQATADGPTCTCFSMKTSDLISQQ